MCFANMIDRACDMKLCLIVWYRFSDQSLACVRLFVSVFDHRLLACQIDLAKSQIACANN